VSGGSGHHGFAGRAHFAAGLALLGIFTASIQDVGAQPPLQPALRPAPVPGAGPQTVTAGPEYAAGAFRRFFMGTGYRDLWTAPIRVPVLDLRREAGGLKPLRVGGGFQTQTIHFRGGDDGYYLFRSINKAVREGLEPDLQDTPAGWIVQEHTNAFHPAGEWVVAPLLKAVGVPSTAPRLFVMPDDPILGEHRERFAGVLGMLIESPDKGESGRKRFQGSDDILGTEDLLERIEASANDRIDTRSFLRARLVDFIVGDPDRNFDNYRWIAFDSAGTRTWVAVPMDRDPAFLEADGLFAGVARNWILPKLVNFGSSLEDFEDVYGLWASNPESDRLLLAELDRPTWDATVAAVRRELTDGVLQEAVAALPDEYERLNGESLLGDLKARRDQLPEAASHFYEALAREVDVQATGADDVAELVHGPDGAVSVSLHGGCTRLLAYREGARPGGGWACTQNYFDRRFVPTDTREVRVYLRGGNDRAVVRGDGPQLIQVRVLGGAGNDVFEDTSNPSSSSRTAFYDHEGDNTFASERGTRVIESAWDGRVITDFVFEDKETTYRDHGSEAGWFPIADHDPAAGVILGARWGQTTYGFRRDPWASRLDITGLVGLRGGFGVDIKTRQRLEGSSMVLAGQAKATKGLSSYRFFGFGNGLPLGDHRLALVPTDEVRLQGGLELSFGESGGAFLGPVARYTSPNPDPAGPLARSEMPGSDAFGQVGGVAELDLSAVDDHGFPRSGVALLGNASGYAPIWSSSEWFGGADAELRAYIPLPAGSTLASRVGGALAWGDFPVHDAVFLGGRRNLRGYKSDRFAGDRSLFGSSELRVPLGRMTLLTRGDFGVSGFVDAGRVYLNGRSPGGWHTAFGGGVWYHTMGISAALQYAVGEENRLHAYFGLPF
jgi:hypothetical protein